MTALLYQLFKPVNKSLALIATFIMLVGLAIQATATLFQLGPLALLHPGAYLNVFDVNQLKALALLLLNLNEQANRIALVFYGVFWILIGYMIFRSTFMPRPLGALFAVAVELIWSSWCRPSRTSSSRMSGYSQRSSRFRSWCGCWSSE